MITHAVNGAVGSNELPSNYKLFLESKNWLDAELFCKNYCNSHLASLHNQTDENNAIEIIMNDSILNNSVIFTKDIWIGLYFDTNQSNYIWTDQTEFAYKYDKLNGTTDYVQMSCNNQQQQDRCPWYTISKALETEQMFLCNDCAWNILTKYIFMGTDKDEPNLQGTGKANTLCNDELSTTLASIHSDIDMNEVSYLSKISKVTDGVWIGLTDHINFDGIESLKYSFLDGTTWDYGTNITGSVWPWDTGEPGAGGSGRDCVQIAPDLNYGWKDKACSYQRKIICNKPTDLCYPNKWNIVAGIWTFSNSNWNCDVINTHNTSLNISKIVSDVSDKQWSHLSLEYMYKI
eukprot:384279_1